MKNPITTKDLGTLNELMIFEQWAATKFRLLYDSVEEPELKTLFADISLEHSQRRESLLKYLKTNAKAGGNN